MSKKRRRSSLVETPQKKADSKTDSPDLSAKRQRPAPEKLSTTPLKTINGDVVQAQQKNTDQKAASATLVHRIPSLDELCVNISASSRAILSSRPAPADDKPEVLIRSERVHLLLTMKHVPKVKRILRFKLPHSLCAPADTKCLIVKDTVGRNYDKTGRHWRELLAEKGVSLDSLQVLSLRELTVSYMSHEAKRQFVCSHDWFLTDKRVAHRLPNKLGRMAYGRLRARIPSPLDLEAADLPAQIKSAEHLVRLYVDGRGARVACIIGHRDMPATQLEDQLRAVMAQLSERLPGGVDNLRAATLSADGMPEVPLFASLLPLEGAPPADDVPPEDTWEQDLAAFRQELGYAEVDLAQEEARDSGLSLRKEKEQVKKADAAAAAKAARVAAQAAKPPKASRRKPKSRKRGAKSDKAGAESDKAGAESGKVIAKSDKVGAKSDQVGAKVVKPTPKVKVPKSKPAAVAAADDGEKKSKSRRKRSKEAAAKVQDMEAENDLLMQ